MSLLIAAPIAASSVFLPPVNPFFHINRLFWLLDRSPVDLDDDTILFIMMPSFGVFVLLLAIAAVFVSWRIYRRLNADFGAPSRAGRNRPDLVLIASLAMVFLGTQLWGLLLLIYLPFSPAALVGALILLLIWVAGRRIAHYHLLSAFISGVAVNLILVFATGMTVDDPVSVAVQIASLIWALLFIPVAILDYRLLLDLRDIAEAELAETGGEKVG